MSHSIGVFCASSNRIPEAYARTAALLGEGLALRRWPLVYGGGDVGLMGVLARSVHRHGGHVIGFIPRRLMAIEGRAYAIADELVVTDTMPERKAGIFERSDGFIVLPGGIGTLEEFLEIITLKHLAYHSKPVVLLDDRGFYRTLVAFLDETVELGFTSGTEGLYHVARNAPEALDLLADRLS